MLSNDYYFYTFHFDRDLPGPKTNSFRVIPNKCKLIFVTNEWFPSLFLVSVTIDLFLKKRNNRAYNGKLYDKKQFRNNGRSGENEIEIRLRRFGVIMTMLVRKKVNIRVEGNWGRGLSQKKNGQRLSEKR